LKHATSQDGKRYAEHYLITKILPMKLFKTTLTLCFVLLAYSPLVAQFQGQITMKVYSEDKGNVEENLVNMYVTDQRIMLQGNSGVNLASAMNAEGLLIRNDKKDFILLTGEQSALQVTKQDIQNLISMANKFDSGGKAEQSASSVNYRFTDRNRTILGMEATELIVEDAENDNYMAVWLTPNVDINWGILTDSWSGLDPEMDKVLRTSQETIFRGQSFPLLVEAYSAKKGQRDVVMEVVNLQKSSVAKAMVEIPQGVKIMGFSDFMFQLMMQQN
jgi:hypothetical protein